MMDEDFITRATLILNRARSRGSVPSKQLSEERAADLLYAAQYLKRTQPNNIAWGQVKKTYTALEKALCSGDRLAVKRYLGKISDNKGWKDAIDDIEPLEKEPGESDFSHLARIVALARAQLPVPIRGRPSNSSKPRQIMETVGPIFGACTGLSESVSRSATTNEPNGSFLSVLMLVAEYLGETIAPETFACLSSPSNRIRRRGAPARRDLQRIEHPGTGSVFAAIKLST
jgi:hypothetical protein